VSRNKDIAQRNFFFRLIISYRKIHAYGLQNSLWFFDNSSFEISCFRYGRFASINFCCLTCFFAFAIFISLTIFHDKFYHDGLACIEYILQNTFSQAFFSKYI